MCLAGCVAEDSIGGASQERIICVRVSSKMKCHSAPCAKTVECAGTLRVVDYGLICCMVAFAITSLVYEPYITFNVDLRAAEQSYDPVARSWRWYAASFDPIFLDTPLWLRVMCTIDFVLFGPMYLVLLYGFIRTREWVREIGIAFASALLYSTIVYFAVECIQERARADLLMVFVINIPYSIFPAVLLHRLWAGPAFRDAHEKTH